MSRYDIAVLPGDGIGPEITEEAVRVLNAATATVGVDLQYERLESGAGRWRKTGVVMTDAEYASCEKADAILMGALGYLDALRPDGTEVQGEVGFRLRFGLDLYAGIRPVHSFQGAPSPLVNGAGIDYVVVRENVEGLFASRDGGTNVRDEVATDTMVVTRVGTEKIVRAAFELALKRASGRPGQQPHVTCIDKANVLSSYAFFRKIFDETARDYPQVTTDHVYVDAMTYYQVRQPQSFDVVVAENFIGDIISDLSAGTVGGLGLAPSGDIGDHHAMFQSAHGSAPDIAGQNVANPIAEILSGAMMLRWLGERHEDRDALKAAEFIDTAVAETLASGDARTRDLGGSVGTRQAGQAIASRVEKLGR